MKPWQRRAKDRDSYGQLATRKALDTAAIRDQDEPGEILTHEEILAACRRLTIRRPR